MKRAGLAIVAAAMVVAGSGCAKSSSTATSPGGAAKVPAFARGFKPPTSGCGSYPIRQPADPDGVIASLDAQHRAALGGYADFPGSTVKVVKSRWANWKPAHPGPYKVAVSWGQLVSDFQVQIVDNLKKDLGKPRASVPSTSARPATTSTSPSSSSSTRAWSRPNRT